jgi:hypothetical protein
VRGGAVQDLLDALDLYEVVAAADAPDLAVPAQLAGRAHPVVQPEDAAGLQRAAAVHPRQLALHVQLVEERPDAFRQRARRGIQQPRQPAREHARTLLPRHGYVTAAFEEQVAKSGVQLLRAALQVLRLKRGQVQPHPAVDVVADGLRHQEAAGGQDGAHGDAAGLVKVRRDGHLRDRRLRLEALRRRLGEALYRAAQVQHLDQLRDGRGLHRDVFVGEEYGVDAVGVVDSHPVLVQARQAWVQCHWGFSAQDKTDHPGGSPLLGTGRRIGYGQRRGH